jgi:hypothetical protein
MPDSSEKSLVSRAVLSNDHGGIPNSDDYQDHGQDGIACIANLICNSEGRPDKLTNAEVFEARGPLV